MYGMTYRLDHDARMYATTYLWYGRSMTNTLDQVNDRFGIRLAIVNVAGGNHVLRARLDGGAWLVATEANDYSDQTMETRIAREECEGALGWYVGIYPHDDAEDGPHPYAYVWDQNDDATTEQLGDVIASALAKMPKRKLHITDKSSWSNGISASPI